jgi:signal recognition particle receptor subunit beta
MQMGQNIERFTLTVPERGREDGQEVAILVRDVGASMMSIWEPFVKEIDALVFFIDTTKPLQLAGAAVELMGLLRHPTFYRASGESKPLLIVCTKVDVRAPRVTFDAIAEVLRFPDLARAMESGPPDLPPANPFLASKARPADAPPPPRSSSLERVSMVAMSAVNGKGVDDVVAWIRDAALDTLRSRD